MSWSSAVPCPPSPAGTSKQHSREGREEVKQRGTRGSVYVTGWAKPPTPTRIPMCHMAGKISRASGRNTQILTCPGKTYPAGKDVALWPPRSRSQLWCCTGADCRHLLQQPWAMSHGVCSSHCPQGRRACFRKWWWF